MLTSCWKCWKTSVRDVLFSKGIFISPSCFYTLIPLWVVRPENDFGNCKSWGYLWGRIPSKWRSRALGWISPMFAPVSRLEHGRSSPCFLLSQCFCILFQGYSVAAVRQSLSAGDSERLSHVRQPGLDRPISARSWGSHGSAQGGSLGVRTRETTTGKRAVHLSHKYTKSHTNPNTHSK